MKCGYFFKFNINFFAYLDETLTIHHLSNLAHRSFFYQVILGNNTVSRKVPLVTSQK